MCGFIEYLGSSLFPDRSAECSLLQRMADTMLTNGPDDSVLCHKSMDEIAMGFAHRCISIVGLSPAGHQPTECLTGRIVVAYDDENYNHSHLHRELNATGHTNVPFSAFLSGGLRLSALISLMQIQSNEPIEVFTMDFHEDLHKEAIYGRAVAQHLNADHKHLY